MIEINNLTDFSVDKRLFTGVAKIVLKGENRERENISLAFIEKEEIKKLNKKFLGKNKPTDVLSFNLNDKDCLGEIVICPEVAKTKQEMVKVLIHGILHLLGYEHEKSKREAEKMEEREKKYLLEIKNSL